MKCGYLITPLIFVILALQPVLACGVVHTTDVDVSPPERIPVWIAENYNDLCGYFTPDGYFSTVFELDAFYRWKYPDIYDSRFIELACKSHNNREGCVVNRTFMEWYWTDTDYVRKWLRDIWNYPRDWREIIPLSKMLFYEGGETVDALDDDVAITKDILEKAKQKYGNMESTATPVTRVEYDGKIPAIYKNIIERYNYIEDLAVKALSNPVTWTFTGLVALIVAVLSSNAVAVAILVYSNRVGRYKREFRFFRKLY